MDIMAIKACVYVNISCFVLTSWEKRKSLKCWQRRHCDCLPVSVRPKWNQCTFMILFLNAVFFQEDSPVWIAFALKTGSNLYPWTTISGPSFENTSIINLFSPCFYLLFRFCVSQIENGLLWCHKLGYSRTIIMMRFSFAGNFGLLFLTVNAQNNFV